MTSLCLSYLTSLCLSYLVVSLSVLPDVSLPVPDV